MSERLSCHNDEQKKEDDVRNNEKPPNENVEKKDEESNIPKKETKRKTLLKYFKEFTSSTSLHGLQYIGEDGRPMTERVWWAMMFFMSLATCVYLIWKVWSKWQHIPVIVSFAESSTPVWQITFPAVTICPESKCLQSIFNYTDVIHKDMNKEKIADWELRYLQVLQMVCESSNTKGKNFTDQSSIEMLKDVAPQMDDTLIVCRWKSQEFPCSNVFTPIITEDGICYTFNMLNGSELFKKEMLHEDFNFVNNEKISTGWNLQTGYPKDLPLYTYPYRGPGSGANVGLTVMLMSNSQDIDYICRGPSLGYKVTLHTPAEIPKVSQSYVLIPHNQNILIAMKPNMMMTSDGLINYDPVKRNCFYPYERKLKYFKHYTRDNCLLECLSNYTAYTCGCVQFFMPRDPNTTICSVGKLDCAEHVIDELLTRDIITRLKKKSIYVETEAKKKRRKRKNMIAAMCVCLPGCTSITYEVETSQSDFPWREFLIATNNYNYTRQTQENGPYNEQKMQFCEKNNITYNVNTSRSADNIQFSAVTIFFKEPEFIMSLRSELYGQTDFLANCGGLLGLCLGFSILSLIEIFYFLTLRAFCNLKRRFSRKTTSSEVEPIPKAFE